MQQKSIVLRKENLFHDLVAFDHLEEVDDVKISIELVNALV